MIYEEIEIKARLERYSVGGRSEEKDVKIHKNNISSKIGSSQKYILMSDTPSQRLKKKRTDCLTN